MRKSIFLAILALLPVLVLAHADNPHDELIIRMTGNGFEPRELTVTEGDEVLFINNDDTDRWPASNFHPTHTLYPEFDPQKYVLPGESWKHIFDRPGTWRMHDHLIPHMTGTIVVLEAPTATTSEKAGNQAAESFWPKLKSFFTSLWQKLFAESTGAASLSGNIKENLLEEFQEQSEQGKYAWLEKRAELESPTVAWEYVLAAYSTPEGVIGNPHDMAHLVGQLLFKDRGFDGLTVCTPVFAFGCYHGLMEVAFDKYKDEKSDANYKKGLLEARVGCTTVGSETTPTYWSCIHGMGHGVVTFREHDLNKALSDCDLLAASIRTYCHDGIFMELSISAPENFYRESDAIYPCDAIEERYSGSCARSQVQVMRLRMGFETDAIARECLKTGNAAIIFHCVDAVGYFIGQSSQGAAEKIISGCREIENEAASAQCLAAAAGELVFQDMRGWQEATEKVCRSLAGDYRGACEKRVAEVKQSYGRN